MDTLNAQPMRSTDRMGYLVKAISEKNAIIHAFIVASEEIKNREDCMYPVWRQVCPGASPSGIIDNWRQYGIYVLWCVLASLSDKAVRERLLYIAELNVLAINSDQVLGSDCEPPLNGRLYLCC